ncbi:MAG: RNA polymerase sigma factor [Mediterranea massiliensis]|nr:RNA polymerase sigma factor [Mediterranea massiliensis]
MDAEGFKNVILPLHKKLYAIAYRLLEDSADAEDLVQEAYVKLWDKRNGLELIHNPEAYCITLVRNMCIDQLRSGRYLLMRQTEELALVQDEIVVEDLTCQSDVELIRKIIDTLPLPVKQIVDMRDVKGLSYQEIESLTGLTGGHIRVLLSRARKKIREEYYKRSNYESR